jgi:uncharacterized membrane protein YdbT with pleckstrin-like domain
MSDVEKYLLPREQKVVVARRHWAVMLPQFLKAFAAWIVLIAIVAWTDSDFVAAMAAFFLLFAALWLGYVVLDWYHEQFAVTDKRILLLSGIFVRKLGIMPLIKVTDLTYERNLWGRLLGYGTFIIESAGQDQALSRIDFVNHPWVWYRRISEKLFSGTSPLVDYDDVAPNVAPNVALNPTDRLPRL